VGLTADGHIIAHDIGASGGVMPASAGVDILAGAGVEMQGVSPAAVRPGRS
jgi:hypothetical protein